MTRAGALPRRGGLPPGLVPLRRRRLSLGSERMGLGDAHAAIVKRIAEDADRARAKTEL